MYPMSTPQMPSYTPGASFLPQGLPQSQLGVGQSGGLLSKLLGGASTGGGGITNILNMLQNAQKAIGIAQSVGPMVQQYAPLVKSLPALIGIMKGSGITNSENAEQDKNKKIVKKKETDSKQKKKQPKKKRNLQQKSSTKSPTEKKFSTKTSQSITKQKKTKKNPANKFSSGIPAPKLYI